MSEATKIKINMKSTIKIALANQGNLAKPVIKIVQPKEVLDLCPSERYVSDDDSRDHLISNFLQSPMNPWLNEWFQVDTRYPVTPDHYVTNIAAVQEEDLFNRFEQAILNRMMPHADHLSINRGINTIGESIDGSIEKHKRIIEFFKWLNESERATWEEQQPDSTYEA